MIKPVQIFRLLYINYVLARHGLDDIIFEIHLFRPFRFLIYLMPWNWLARDRAPKGQRVREALEDLGPIFIKFGQMLSTRKDLLPENIIEELVALQDNVPPFEGEKARQIIEQAFGKSIDDLFDEFDNTPLASASVAQVHTAKLKNGKDIVVKVLRPNVLPVIKRDIALLKIIAKLAERYSKDARRLRAVEIVSDYEKTILDELDLMREAANASQLRRNFEHSSELYIPEVNWDYTRRNVMVMERIHGISMAGIEEMKASGVNMKRLSELGVEIFFTQVFTHNFFHADMHPGNLFVDTSDLDQPKYIAVDFGIVGTLSPDDQRYLAENFLAFFKRDYNRVAQLHVDSGWVPKGTRVDEFESAIRSVCEPIFERPLKEISFGQLLLRLFQTAQRFNMEVQPQLVLLQKTLLNIEGLGRQIYPDLDLWKTAKPFLEKWMNNQVGMSALLRGFKKNLPYIAEKMPEMPELIFDALKQVANGEGHIKQAQALNEFKEKLERKQQQLSYTVLGGCSFIVAAIILVQPESNQVVFFQVPVLSWMFAVIGSAFVWAGLKK